MHRFVAGALPGFVKWISDGAWLAEPGQTDTIHVAAFSGDGLSVTSGFHTLTTTTPLIDPPRYYNAFVIGHGPAGTPATHTAYAYLAGYDCK